MLHSCKCSLRFVVNEFDILFAEENGEPAAAASTSGVNARQSQQGLDILGGQVTPELLMLYSNPALLQQLAGTYLLIAFYCIQYCIVILLYSVLYCIVL